MSIAEKLTTVAENQQRVYDAGKQAEYDRFWDAYQQNGTRGSYSYAFGGVAWTDETLKPKYLPLGNTISQSAAFGQAFYYANQITKSPQCFSYYWSSWTGAFHQCTRLVEIGEISGEIGRSFDCPHSQNLSAESMIMVINRLKNYSNHADLNKYKLTFHATAWANLEAHSTAPNGGTWKDYVTSKGWLYG